MSNAITSYLLSLFLSVWAIVTILALSCEINEVAMSSIYSDKGPLIKYKRSNKTNICPTTLPLRPHFQKRVTLVDY